MCTIADVSVFGNVIVILGGEEAARFPTGSSFIYTLKDDVFKFVCCSIVMTDADSKCHIYLQKRLCSSNVTLFEGTIQQLKLLPIEPLEEYLRDSTPPPRKRVRESSSP